MPQRIAIGSLPLSSYRMPRTCKIETLVILLDSVQDHSCLISLQDRMEILDRWERALDMGSRSLFT